MAPISVSVKPGDRAQEGSAAPKPVKMAARNLNFYYGKFHAVKDVNIEIREHVVTAFIGPSGCGKSTLLRIFNRMYDLYPRQRAEGEVVLDGENILTVKSIRQLAVKGGHGLSKADAFPHVDQ